MGTWCRWRASFVLGQVEVAEESPLGIPELLAGRPQRPTVDLCGVGQPGGPFSTLVGDRLGQLRAVRHPRYSIAQWSRPGLELDVQGNRFGELQRNVWTRYTLVSCYEVPSGPEYCGIWIMPEW